MLIGSKEWFDKYATTYRDFLKTWDLVFSLNQKGDFSQGWATTNGNGDYIITYENGGLNK